MLLLMIVALLAASVPTFHATPLTTQLTVVMDAYNHGNSTKSEMEMETRDVHVAMRTLQAFPFDINPGGTNVTCPPECPLCECESTEDAACMVSKSVEACASDSLERCYADLLPGDYDIQGLCTVQCDKPDENIPSGVSVICRLCDIFACCNECPPERAAECFPPSVEEDGYTPVGWEPATCSGVIEMRVAANGLSLLLAVSFAFVGIFT